MMAGIAVIVRGPSHDFPGAGVFVVVVLLLIVLIFIRVYGRGDPARRRTAFRSRRQTTHHASHSPERGGSQGRRPARGRRGNRP
jgi:hypothetical protein